MRYNSGNFLLIVLMPAMIKHAEMPAGENKRDASIPHLRLFHCDLCVNTT